LKHTILAALAALAILATAPLNPAMAEKKLSPQQMKMKDCGAKWTAHKKAANVSGRTEHRKFMSGCLKG
jgi:hypothetical protein